MEIEQVKQVEHPPLMPPLPSRCGVVAGMSFAFCFDPLGDLSLYVNWNMSSSFLGKERA